MPIIILQCRLLTYFYSVCRSYIFCSPVRCCHAFDAAGPTTNGTRSTTADDRRDSWDSVERERIAGCSLRSVNNNCHLHCFCRNTVTFISRLLVLSWSISTDVTLSIVSMTWSSLSYTAMHTASVIRSLAFPVTYAFTVLSYAIVSKWLHISSIFSTPVRPTILVFWAIKRLC